MPKCNFKCGMGVLLKIFCTFLEHLFLEGCFCIIPSCFMTIYFQKLPQRTISQKTKANNDHVDMNSE